VFHRRETTMILQLNPPLWFDTRKGRALAHFVVDAGLEHELEFVCFHQNGEVWSWSQSDVRAATNMTLGRERTEFSAVPKSAPTHMTLVEGNKD
jgi:hypothetical protein